MLHKWPIAASQTEPVLDNSRSLESCLNYILCSVSISRREQSNIALSQPILTKDSLSPFGRPTGWKPVWKLQKALVRITLCFEIYSRSDMPVNAMLIPGPRHLQLMFTMYIDTWSGSLWKHVCQMLYCLICFQTSIMATGELCLWLATLSLPPDARIKVCRQKRPGTSSYKRSLFTMCKSLQQAYPPTAGSGEWALAFNQPSFFSSVSLFASSDQLRTIIFALPQPRQIVQQGNGVEQTRSLAEEYCRVPSSHRGTWHPTAHAEIQPCFRCSHCNLPAQYILAYDWRRD